MTGSTRRHTASSSTSSTGPDVGRARPAGEDHVVDGRAVRVDARHVAPAQVGQLGQRADAAHVPAPAAPDRQRRAPVAVARQGPVDVVLEPLAEAPVLDVRRVPVHGLVGRQQVVLAGRRGDVPARLAPVDQRRAAAPAVRVRVDVGEAAQQQPLGLQPVVDVVVGLPDVHARPATPTASVKRPSGPTGFSEGRPFSRPIWRSISPKAGARCTKPRPFLGRHVRRRHHAPPVGAVRRVQVVERALVVQPDQRRARAPGPSPGPTPPPPGPRRPGPSAITTPSTTA